MGCLPGTIGERNTHASLPGNAPDWSFGNKPAMTRLDLPEPLGPMIVRSRPLLGAGCSTALIPFMSLTSWWTDWSRPKKSPASLAVKARSPLYGLRGSFSGAALEGPSSAAMDLRWLRLASMASRAAAYWVSCASTQTVSLHLLLWLRVFVVTYPDEDQPALVQVGQAQVLLDGAQGARLGRDNQYDSLSGADGQAHTLFFVSTGALVRGVLSTGQAKIAALPQGVGGENSGEVGIGRGSAEEDALAGDRLDEWPGGHQHVQWEDKGSFEVGWAAGCDNHANDALQAGIPDGGAAEARCDGEALRFHVFDHHPVGGLPTEEATSRPHAVVVACGKAKGAERMLP